MSKKENSYCEKDISTNLLVSLKHMKAEFNTFTQEAGSEELYKEIDKAYKAISQLQRKVFEMMSAQGWYVMSGDTPANISKAYTKFYHMESEL